MTAIEPLTNLSGGVESQDARSLTASARHAHSACKHVESAKDDLKCSALVRSDNASGSSAPPAQKLCPDCESREIAPTEDLCVICWFARNDENPDGRWVNTEHAGWLYE